MFHRNDAVKLQELLNTGLQFGTGRLRLSDEARLSPAAKRVLKLFDSNHGEGLLSEYAALSKTLADGGATLISNHAVPAGFQRTVIREALSDLKILDLVNVLVDPTTQVSVQIPYEVRKTGTVANDGIVYESAGIPRAAVELKSDTAFLQAGKLSFVISNEMTFFSANSPADWDGVSRNIESNARVMRALLARRIANELQRSADAYGAVENVTDDVTARLNGSHSLLKTAYFPIVRPKQVKTLHGLDVGGPEHPISLVIDGTTIAAFDGTGSQTAGVYWKVENFNLGYVRVVDQAGAAVTPTAATAASLTYSAAGNVAKFDLKLPSGYSLEDHLDGLLRLIGSTKATMAARRAVVPDFLLMSPVLNDTITNANSFVWSAARPGSALAMGGDLETIKSVPAFSTNAPGLDLGDERILMGAVGVASYAIAKPFETGRPFESVANNLPTGQRMAYGEEYSVVHVPAELRPRLTSVVVFDSDARAAAA